MAEWIKAPVKPVNVGIYEAAIYDAGWIYEWKVWWDGRMWRDKENGSTLIEQNPDWRELNTGNEPSV